MSKNITNRQLRETINSGKIPETYFTDAQLKDIKVGSSKIGDFTWHHNAQSAPHNIQLVPSVIHSAVPHNGTRSLHQ